MPVKTLIQHPALHRLPTALRATMDARRHTQQTLSVLTGVPQPQISRVLAGKRKRLTPAIKKLCVYADIAFEQDTALLAIEIEQLKQLLGEIAGGNVDAATALNGVLQSLAPIFGLALKKATSGVGSPVDRY